MYKINYSKLNQKGGNNDIITFIPDYPNNLEESRSNEWPPKLNSKITIKDENTKKVFNGTVVQNIWNETASIVDINDDSYIEMSLRDESKYNNGKGFFLLLPDYLWSYGDNISNTNKESYIENNYNEFDNNSESPKNVILNDKSSNIISNNSDYVDDRINVSQISYEDNNDSKIIKSGLEKAVPENHEIITKNKFYKPLLAKPKKDYFSDSKLDISISNSSKILTSLDFTKVEILTNKLRNFENIENKDIFIVTNKNITIDNVINDPNDEINEGSKIINWINEVLISKVFTDLIVKIHEGYVYITRNGVNVIDTINKNIVPSLKHFSWQEGQPINYDTLKYVIFQNSFQQNLKDNIEQKREAEDILSQEYIIALQPSPLYQLWTLKRLIMIWYSDPLIEKYIRKVKVIINQFRCDPNKSYNKENGILGSILIYPKYGVKSTKEILSKIEYYFSLYIDENSNPRYQDIQWKNSQPSYFIKKNSLIYYTNGSIELKNYIKRSIKSGTNIKNSTLTSDFTEFLESDRLMAI